MDVLLLSNHVEKTSWSVLLVRASPPFYFFCVVERREMEREVGYFSELHKSGVPLAL